MDVLVDTNLLVRGTEADHPHHSFVTPALLELTFRGDRLCVVAQVLYEYYVVCTRPPGHYGGLGMSSQAGMSSVRRAESLFHLLPDPPELYVTWQRLVEQHGIVGKRSHDVRLVAMMEIHRIQSMLTFNARDFARFPGVQILSPEELATAWRGRPSS